MVALIGELLVALEPSAAITSYAAGPGVDSDITTGCRIAVEKEPRNEVEGVSWPKAVGPAISPVTEEAPEMGLRETAAVEPTERPAETDEPADRKQFSPCAAWP
mmetsp:Transcript_20405/g.55636  ORF Transcript_20405/g.55636 Transcript_20405/m.55636 type:complete len:104 (-) Transcript_20405:1129-1440(-)